MMESDTLWQQLVQFGVSEATPEVQLIDTIQVDIILRLSACHNPLGVVDGLLTRVDEHQHLFAMLEHFGGQIIRHLIVDVLLLAACSFGSLDGVLDTHKFLAEGYGSIGLVEEEHTILAHLQEDSHIPVIGEGGTQPHQPDQSLSSFHLLQCASYDALQDGSPRIIQQMNFVDDEQLQLL